ncbi:tRNA (guanosine(37)-N1)-methyltransferase TrmD [Buchnera aphidicola]|uniref:tRNA (guanosine(37)-N1)-methyltransferase TrmD n=1 Tax=Buchnera aphidicola TaxID=9 RepID=UPI0034641DD9
MHFNIISIFPKMFDAIIKYGIVSRAIKKNIISIKIWNPRDYTYDKYHTIDDRPYGGGSGMLMKAEPLLIAIEHAKKTTQINTKIIYLSPQGKPLNQKSVSKLSKISNFILICGRYKGIDERVIHSSVDEEWSIGDYITTGGELPAMIFIDTLSRLIPNLIGKKIYIEEDSFCNGLLDCPQYTRPNFIKGIPVPKILLSGHHLKIKKWKLKQSLGATWLKRPDLLKVIKLSEEQKTLLSEFKKDWNKK